MSEASIDNSMRPDPVQQRADRQTASELLKSCAPHQRALLRILAVSIHNEIDPTPLILGFADELSSNYANRARWLVKEISRGVDVVDAIEQVPDLLPASTVLALRLAREDGTFPGLTSALMERFPGDQDGSNQDESPVSIVARLMGRIFFMVLILSFMMLKIVPEFQNMFEEFGIELPATMRLLMRLSDLLLTFWFLVPLFLIVVIPFCIPALRQYFNRWNILTWRHPATSRSADQRRALALITQTKQSVSSGIALLLGTQPVRRPFKRFSRVNEKIETSQDVWGSLAAERVISRRDAKALSLSTDGNTQAWLLRWSANDRQDRAATRFVVLFRLVLAIVHISLGLLVMLTCVAVFMSLIAIIEGPW